LCSNLADEIEAIWDKDKNTCVPTNDVDEAIILADRIIALNPTAPWAMSSKSYRPPARNLSCDERCRLQGVERVTRYLMDVGIASKVEETRLNVTPIHGADGGGKARAAGSRKYSRSWIKVCNAQRPLTVG
jgi:nitrate/nitrite transport system ATP-binding protein